MKIRYIVPKVPVYLFVALVSLIALIPFYMMLIMGTYVNEELFTGIKLFPGNYLRGNFASVMRINFMRYYGNSLMVAVTHTAGAVFVSALTGYAFAKYRFKGRNAIFGFVVATLAIPPQVGMVGFVVEMRMLHWVNTLLPLIIPGLGNAFAIFWMTQYITAAVPLEVIESGRIDGCGEFGIFFRLALPIIRPAVITMSLLLFLWSWNNYMTPLIIISKQNLYTVPLAIAALLANEYRTDNAARILALALGTIPILTIFAIGSKHLIRGMVAGSIKG
jgi:multiple sugar transport system permease protein/cellobiose transport system permease protein